MTTFSKQLRQEADRIWQASFDHPFVTGISDGSLPMESFRYYVMQDAYYLSHFARIQALGASKADDLDTSGRMAAHVLGTVQAELSLHEKFSKLLHISEEEKAAFEPAPTAYAYTSHMYRAAQNGHLGDVIAAILPCYWLYHEIGERLQGSVPGNPIYQEWIDAYGGESFAALVREQIDRVDEIAGRVTEADRERMKRHFMISSRYELMFWEMAFRQEKWAI